MLEIVDPAVIGRFVAAGLFAGILLTLRAGRTLGLRAIARFGSDARPSIGSLETAVFALLGLLIAFTFSGALTRFDVRRAHVVDEANAIGTAWLRLDLVPASAQPKLRQTFRDYLDARLATYRGSRDPAAIRATVARSQALQAEIWTQAVAALRLPESRPQAEMLLLPALNGMFDITTVRMTAPRVHPPLIIYVMLIGLALASALLAGYQSASEKGYDWVQKIGFAAIVAFTVYVILDIEYPRLGFVRIDAIDQVLVDLRATMSETGAR